MHVKQCLTNLKRSGGGSFTVDRLAELLDTEPNQIAKMVARGHLPEHDRLDNFRKIWTANALRKFWKDRHNRVLNIEPKPKAKARAKPKRAQKRSQDNLGGTAA